MPRSIKKVIRPSLHIFLTLALGAMTPGAALAADSEAWTVYQGLLEACESATSMESLLPYLAEWKREAYEAADEADREASLKRTCGATSDLKDIALVSETAADTETVLQLEAAWDDFPMKGKITLVREEDGLKVSEWSWATGR